MIKKYLTAGLLFWLPLIITVFILQFIIKLLDQVVAWLPIEYQPTELFGFHIPGAGLIITLVLIFATGVLVTNFLGRFFIRAWEKLLSRIPLVRSIYSATKQLIGALFSSSGDSFKKVLLVEYPRKGVWSIGFQTNNNFQTPIQDDGMISIFIPTTPNPTSGFLTLVPRDTVTELDMSVEEAFKTVVSLGVVMPNSKEHTS